MFTASMRRGQGADAFTSSGRAILSPRLLAAPTVILPTRGLADAGFAGAEGRILALLKRQPELALRMLGSMSSHLRACSSASRGLTLKDVETRLANWLVNVV